MSEQYPTLFPENIQVTVSTKEDGTVLDRAVGIHDGSVVSNRTEVCRKNGYDYGDVVYQRIVYDTDASYDLIAEVDDRSTTKVTDEVVADALFTAIPNIGLMLPVGDCIPTILHDPELQLLAMAHMGRHSTLTDLLPKLVGRFKEYGSDPSDLLVWMGPSAQRQSYRMEYFDRANDPAWQGFFDRSEDGFYLDMQGFNEARLIDAGVKPSNIERSPIDTVTHPNFFSHSAGDTTGRFAVVAIMHSVTR